MTIDEDPYRVKIDPFTFDALICDCYRHVHSPFRKMEVNGKWTQVPYHYGEDWNLNNDMTWLDELIKKDTEEEEEDG